MKSVNHEIADVSAKEGELDDEQGKGNPKNVSLYVFPFQPDRALSQRTLALPSPLNAFP